MPRVRENYRRHSLVVAETGSGWLGVIWGNRKKIHECEGPSEEAVLDMLRTFVDESFVTIAKERPAPPSGDEYVHAFRAIVDDLPDSYRAMLKGHYHAPNQEITTTALADAAGYSNYSSANLHYGTLGKMLYEVLPIEVEKGSDGQPVYTFALATAGDTRDSEERWTWKMRPGVAYALEQLGLTT